MRSPLRYPHLYEPVNMNQERRQATALHASASLRFALFRLLLRILIGAVSYAEDKEPRDVGAAQHAHSSMKEQIAT